MTDLNKNQGKEIKNDKGENIVVDNPKPKVKKVRKPSNPKTKNTTSKTKKGGVTMKEKVDRDKTFNDIISRIRQELIQPEIKGNAELTLVENRHGALQVKRNGGLLFSLRKCDWGVTITHPMFSGKGKSKTRIYPHASNNEWDHLSKVPFDKVTKTMLVNRIKDKKSAMDWHNEIYAGRMHESGLVKKRSKAAARGTKEGLAEQVKKREAELKAMKAELRAKTKKSPKKTSKKTSAITKVAEQTS